jgi:hypothetical protein
VKEKDEKERAHEHKLVTELFSQVTKLGSLLDATEQAEFRSQIVGLVRDVLTRRRRLDSGPHIFQTGQNSEGGTENMPGSRGATGPITNRREDPPISEPPDSSSAAS